MPFIYRDNFITDEQCKKINSLPKGRWVSLKNRRLQEWGARSLPDGTKAMGEDFPDWLEFFSKQIQKEFPEIIPVFNQCLINEYEVGQGIMPHEDGPCYDPVIATLSVGCYTILDLYPKDSQDSVPKSSLLLEQNSCLILYGDYYTDYLHGIQESPNDELPYSQILNRNETDSLFSRTRTSTRISLTFRKHNKVIRPKFLRFK